jgi:hypothetical protein
LVQIDATEWQGKKKKYQFVVEAEDEWQAQKAADDRLWEPLEKLPYTTKNTSDRLRIGRTLVHHAIPIQEKQCGWGCCVNPRVK